MACCVCFAMLVPLFLDFGAGHVGLYGMGGFRGWVGGWMVVMVGVLLCGRLGFW